MATYNEKYYKQFTRGTHTVRLSVYQRGWSGNGKEIGDFVDLKLELQGQQASIEEPIIKSSVIFSMVDSRDKGDTSTVKYGAWEEFYTPDATLYLIRVAVDGTVIWSGYITPDSWEDDLRYRGIITITARDMIGHLQDFPFAKSDLDAVATDDMASVINVIGMGLSLASVPMELVNYASGTSVHWLTYDTQKIYNWAIDINSLVGKNWYEAIEDLLSSHGLTLRYMGRNIIGLQSVRDVPNMGYDNKALAPEKAPVFLNRSGHRMLTPAYKQITEMISYETSDDNMETWLDSDFRTRTSEGVSYLDINKEGWELLVSKTEGWVDHDGLLRNGMRPYTLSNPYNDEVADKRRYVMLMIYPQMVPIFAYRRTILVAPRVKASINFQIAHGYLNNNGSWGTVQMNMYQGNLRYRLEWAKLNGTSLWLNARSNTWETNQSGPWYNYQLETDKGSAEINISVATPNDPGRLKIWFFIDEGNYSSSNGVRYIRLGEFSITTESDSIPKGLTVNTIYDRDQNTTLKRDSAYGQLPDWLLSAGSVKNGMYKMSYANLYPPIGNSKWNNSGTALPVQVYIHLQLIAMHAKANNILTGDIKDGTADNPCFNARWRAFDRDFVLVGGTLNLVTGTIEDATLIEYDTYEAVCGSITADYTKNDVEGEYKAGQSGASVTVTGGGGSGGGGTVTSVALTMPTGFSVSGSPIATAGTLAVSLQSGYKIPTITEIGYGVSAYNWGNHANAGYASQRELEAGLDTLQDHLDQAVEDLTDYIDGKVATVQDQLKPQPRLTMYLGSCRDSSRHQIVIEHPMIGRDGCEAVLMTYQGRNGRNRGTLGTAKLWLRKKGYAVAMGDHELTDHASVLTATVGSLGFAYLNLDALREFIIKRYMMWSGMTRQDLYLHMDYAGWTRESQEEHRGFKDYTTHHRFGIAVRQLNPEFQSQLIPGHELNPSTQEINGKPRYFYSNTAPLDAFLMSDQGTHNKRLMFFDIDGR